MKRLLLVFAFFFSFASVALAASDQAYQDYIFQFDRYRETYADFRIAKNEYEKYGTLTSQTTALEKTRTMMTQRDSLLRSYLLLLDENLNEDTGLGTTERNLYQTILRNEITFLESHSNLVAAIGSLKDADTVSKQLETRNVTFQASIRQILIAIELGRLTDLQRQYDGVVEQVRSYITDHRGLLSNQMQATIDRWLLQVTNKETLFQQKTDSIRRSNEQLKSRTVVDLNQKFQSMRQTVREAHQDLIDGASNLTEVVRILALSE